MNSTKNIMIVGVGGQGALLASKTLGQVLLDAGFDVKVSEGEIDEIALRWENGVKNFDRTPGGFSFTEAAQALKEIIC